jgi:RHS repeat-associated protein
MLRREKRATGATTAVHTFHWDADGRLRKAFLGNTQFFSAAYGADGRRIKKNDGLSSHLDSFGLYDEITGGGRQPITYTPGFSLREAVAGASTGTDRYFHQDWLGTTRYLTEAGGGLDRAGGALVPYAKRHDAYGLQTAYAGIDDPNGLAPQYAGATGYLRDSSLGLDYLHHRYYDPAIGRFITRDPIGWAGGLNLYGYVGNDPVNAVDPSGLSPWDDFKGGAKAAGVWLLQAPGHLGMAIWKGISPLWAVKIDYGVQPGLRGANAETPGGYALATRGAELSDGIDEMAGGVILPAVGAGLVSIAAARSGPCTSSRPFGRFSMRGRLGSVKTRTQLRAIANELESRGWRVTNGGSRIPHVKEEFIPRGPGRPTGTWVDLTATKNGRILRVQTVDTLVGGQPTLDEALAIGRIRGFQRPGDHLLVVPKVK